LETSSEVNFGCCLAVGDPVVSGNSNRPYSCGIPVVVAQKSTEPQPTLHLTLTIRTEVRLDDLVPQSLVVPLAVATPAAPTTN
jgi:hypothetical protein